MQGTVLAKRSEVPKRLAQKTSELGLVHFAGGHREGSMVDRTETAGVTVDRHVVGRIGENH